jgi:excisionase family DNA binding protein
LSQLEKEAVAQGDPEESYLTVAEVAATLKLNQQTVRNWIDQGSLPALRVGRRVRIKRSDFERILEQSYSGAGSSAADAGPSADDFWSGELVGLAEPGRAPTSATTGRQRGSDPSTRDRA